MTDWEIALKGLTDKNADLNDPKVIEAALISTQSNALTPHGRGQKKTIQAIINTSDSLGETLVFKMIRLGKVDTVLWLVNQGADLNHRNRNDQSPQDIQVLSQFRRFQMKLGIKQTHQCRPDAQGEWRITQIPKDQLEYRTTETDAQVAIQNILLTKLAAERQASTTRCTIL